jgi:hypothetical protein
MCYNMIQEEVRATVIKSRLIAVAMSEITKKSDQQKDAEAEVEGFRKDLGPFVVAAEPSRFRF